MRCSFPNLKLLQAPGHRSFDVGSLQSTSDAPIPCRERRLHECVCVAPVVRIVLQKGPHPGTGVDAAVFQLPLAELDEAQEHSEDDLLPLQDVRIKEAQHAVQRNQILEDVQDDPPRIRVVEGIDALHEVVRLREEAAHELVEAGQHRRPLVPRLREEERPPRPHAVDDVIRDALAAIDQQPRHQPPKNGRKAHRVRPLEHRQHAEGSCSSHVRQGPQDRLGNGQVLLGRDGEGVPASHSGQQGVPASIQTADVLRRAGFRQFRRVVAQVRDALEPHAYAELVRHASAAQGLEPVGCDAMFCECLLRVQQRKLRFLRRRRGSPGMIFSRVLASLHFSWHSLHHPLKKSPNYAGVNSLIYGAERFVAALFRTASRPHLGWEARPGCQRHRADPRSSAGALRGLRRLSP
eukprot:scaffold1221_cov237-Pinguiococcus_pyrenoidosus.AAC.5